MLPAKRSVQSGMCGSKKAEVKKQDEEEKLPFLFN